ncbi:hypothetical protein SISSUDRAFT_1004126 [Sistotremastrum suecicum HHB10207 ss-3]|uniref:Ras-domain-containing protein n=1 Tax=Sistotremastrum suecicum HHB10207 ss-3 TaxID=1314776 RepID=A0A166DYM2_9AGAM|nr:hypothetical protein SISSUDRAFT_1004126 [Sistotremastrum suecicum HHB10207 ss-3]
MKKLSPSVIIICVSVRSRPSFQEIKRSWGPPSSTFKRFRRAWDKTPMILVGTDIESRADPEIVHGLFMNGNREGPVLHEEGERLAKEIGASKYLECSLGDRGQVKQVFEEAFRLISTKWSTCFLQ